MVFRAAHAANERLRGAQAGAASCLVLAYWASTLSSIFGDELLLDLGQIGDGVELAFDAGGWPTP